MRSRLAAVALAVLLPLTACGGGGESAGPDEPPVGAPLEVEATTEPEPVEGPATEPHAWLDGVTARVVSVQARPAVQPENPADDTEVTVTVEFGNQGTQPLSFGEQPNTVDAGPHTGLLYGANRTQAQGWFYGDNNLPTRLTPGTTATWVATFTMPGSETDELAVTVAPTDAHPPWTFTDAETLTG